MDEQPEIKVGDLVKVGKGRTVWEVQEFWRKSADGARFATLHHGWNSTTVLASRIVLVESR